MQNFKKGRHFFVTVSFVKSAARLYHIAALLLFIPLISPAQNQPLINSTLKGQVIDTKTRQPVPGVTILIKGTTHTVQTDRDGKFDFVTGQKFPYTLILRYVGYRPKEVLADGSPITIGLDEDQTQLSDIEVVGYTKIKRAAQTAAITTIQAKELSNAPYTSVIEKLQGQVPGLFISNDSGTPGTSVLVRLRGTNSVNGGNDPLYVVDDVIINSDNLQGLNLGGQLVNPLSDINPNDIESITVLKDANATAVYGARGANGVILIKTNRGGNEKTKINLDLKTGTSTTRNLWELVTGPEHAQIVNEAFVNNGGLYANRPFRPAAEAIAGFPAWGLPEEQQTYDRLDRIFRTAILQQYNLSVAAGNANTNFYMGAEYLNQPSTLKLQDFGRYSFRLNLDHQVNKNLKIGTSNNISSVPRQLVRVGDGGTGLFQAALHTPTFLPLYDENNQYVKHFTFDNVDAILNNNDTHSNSLRSLNNVYAVVNILPSLTFKSSWSSDYNIYREKAYFNTNLLSGQPSGLANDITTTRSTLSADQLLNYNLSRSNFDLAVFAGNSIQYTDNQRQSLTGTVFPSNQHKLIASAGVKTGTATASTSGLLSYFGGANFSFDDRYIIDGTFRADASSRIGKDHRWGYFPAVGANWKISNEKFFPKSDTFNELRFKASWGLTGNASLGDFQSLGLWTGGENYGSNTGIAPSQIPNPDLKWESTRQWNFGLTGVLFKRRLDFEVNYYDKYTKDLLLEDPIPDVTGFPKVTRNAGAISNKGFEFVVNSDNLNSKNISWRTTFTISKNINKVEKLLRPISGGYQMFRLTEGSPISSIWVYKQLGVDPHTGNVIYEDVDGDKKITSADRQLLGSVWPDFEGAFRNTISYRSFELNANVYFRSGNKLFNYTRYFLESGGVRGTERTIQKSQLNYWKKDGDTNVLPRLSSTTNPDGSRNYEPASANANSSRFLEDASFIRLKDVSLSYTLPRRITNALKLTNIRTSFTASNLFTITKYSGPDPEANSQTNSYLVQGLDFNTVPQPRSFVFGLNVTF